MNETSECNSAAKCWNNVKDYCNDNEPVCGEWSEVHGISYYEKNAQQALKICKSKDLTEPKDGWITLLKIGIYQKFILVFQLNANISTMLRIRRLINFY